MSQYENLDDTRLAVCLRKELEKVDAIANELYRRGWKIKFDTLDVSTTLCAQYITSCKITKTHIEELS